MRLAYRTVRAILLRLDAAWSRTIGRLANNARLEIEDEVEAELVRACGGPFEPDSYVEVVAVAGCSRCRRGDSLSDAEMIDEVRVGDRLRLNGDGRDRDTGEWRMKKASRDGKRDVWLHLCNFKDWRFKRVT